MVDSYKNHLDIKELNRMAMEDPQGLIDLAEKRYRDQMAEIADRFAGEFPENRLILLSGPSSAGKTTTSHNLDNELEKRGISTFALSLDDFFFDREMAPRLPDGTLDLETPALIDIELLESCLTHLFAEGSCDFPIFDFKTGKRSEKTFHYEYDDHTAIIICKLTRLMREGLSKRLPLSDGAVCAQFSEEATRAMIPYAIRFQFDLHAFLLVCIQKERPPSAENAP